MSLECKTATSCLFPLPITGYRYWVNKRTSMDGCTNPTFYGLNFCELETAENSVWDEWQCLNVIVYIFPYFSSGTFALFALWFLWLKHNTRWGGTNTCLDYNYWFTFLVNITNHVTVRYNVTVTSKVGFLSINRMILFDEACIVFLQLKLKTPENSCDWKK